MTKSIPASIFFAGCFNLFAADHSFSLAGRWRFELDRAVAGIQQRWFARMLPDNIHLPGSLPAQGSGNPATTNTLRTGGIVDRSWFTTRKLGLVFETKVGGFEPPVPRTRADAPHARFIRGSR